MTDRVSFKSRDGGSVDGALALPAGAGKAPTVVVVQEYWGLNDQIQGIADRLADEGFVALVPDLYHGKLAKDQAEATHLMSSLDWKRAMEDLAGAVGYLREHPRGNGKVAVVGFCMGGALSFAAAVNLPDLAAVVPFYGVPGDLDWTKVTAPVLAHFSKTDRWAKPEIARKIQAVIEENDGSMELHVYDAEHAFMNEKRPEVYNAEAASQAWHRTIHFLREHTA
jgi:carboxymethylenebutenolidase